MHLAEPPSSTLIINFKNYREMLGNGSLLLAREAETVSRGRGKSNGVEVIVCPPVPFLQSIAASVAIPVFSQKIDEGDEGKSTGAIIPESILEAGCDGSILNHSEARIGMGSIERLVARAQKIGLRCCVCAESVDEVVSVSRFSPDFLAIEPPELIGSGISVSKARPELITGSVERARSAGFRGRILCGAGIVTGGDARRARELGAEGVLVASSIVRAEDKAQKIEEMIGALGGR
jgi:triosephosphate isomerase